MSELLQSPTLPDTDIADITAPAAAAADAVAPAAAILPVRSPYHLYNWSRPAFVARGDELVSQGFQPLSLSMYGDPENALFAGVFDKRPGPPLRRVMGFTIDDFRNQEGQNAVDGFYPILVSATGGGWTGARISAYFAKRPTSTHVTISGNLEGFRQTVQMKKAENWIPLSATIFSDAGNSHESMVATVWERNTSNVAWTIVAGLTHDEHQRHFEAQYSGWARPAFVTGSSRGELLAIYRDDQIGPIGQGWAARHGQTKEQYENDYGLLFNNGLYVVCLQGYGAPGAHRFAGIFVKNETPVLRTERATGTTAVEAIDRPVFDMMKASNIRGAALAIVKGTRLVYARGYTWAEPDYPTVQPTTCFRLGSVSKVVTAIGIHQLVAEKHWGEDGLGTLLPVALPLTNPNGSEVTNAEYLTDTVSRLLEKGGRYERYEHEGPRIAAEFKTQLPVTHAQIASYMMITPPMAQPKNRLDDFKYFLAGQVIKRARGANSLMQALAARLTGPLQITRLRSARSLLSAQLPDEARHHSRDLVLFPSVMTPSQPLVPAGYGNVHFETMETSGGLSAAAPDLARILAAMNAKPYTPLGRPAVDSLLEKAAKNGRNGNGHGFDEMTFDPASKSYRGAKGGLLGEAQAGIWFDSNGFSYAILWNGLHTKDDLVHNDGEDVGWSPTFHAILDAARNHAWPASDQFPTFGMPTLPSTRENFRYCEKCQGMFAGGSTDSVCPAGGKHHLGIGNYHLIRNAPFPYGQQDWRSCTKCQSIYYGGFASSICPAGGQHTPDTFNKYTVIMNSPYNEHQPDWRWCNKCMALFHAGLSAGVCPAGGGHSKSGSANYSVWHDPV
jgi:CubicO group peptidase (beta-lactamase class C family)